MNQSDRNGRDATARDYGATGIIAATDNVEDGHLDVTGTVDIQNKGLQETDDGDLSRERVQSEVIENR